MSRNEENNSIQRNCKKKIINMIIALWISQNFNSY